ncbi:MAG: DHA2 family efflux MFS transporter permease subunit [Proteobacteria bacterium]|nr:DHA2 family efflux MFS transporter permease subunit [Pseudomonadota bacterium]
MEEHPPLTGGTLVLATLSLSLGAFMQVLDSTIANVAIPTIAGDIGVSPSQGTWVITSFAVANAIALPLTGWLAQRYGEVRVFVLSTLGFLLASWLCALSSSLEFLVFARVLQGAAAGPMFPLAQSLMLTIYPPRQRGLAIAISMMVITVAPILGPLLGGWITEHISWNWIFYINLPVGLFSILITWQLLKNRESTTRQLPIDYIGLGLLMLGIGCLQVLLDKGNELDWFDSDLIIILAVLSAIALSTLLVWELTDRHPIVDLTLFADRNFAVGVSAISLGYMTFLGGVVVFPLWLQTNMGYTAFWAGVVSAPIGLLPVMLTPAIGKNLEKLNLRIVISLAFAVFALTFWWQSRFADNADLAAVALPRLVQGIGLAGFFAPLTTVLTSRIPPHRMPNAMGLFNFCRVLAGSIGTSLAVTLWDHRTIYHHQRLTEAVNLANPQLAGNLSLLESFGISGQSAYALIDRLLGREAVTLATNDTFWVGGWLFFGLIALIWLARPPFASRGSPPPMSD